MARNIGSSLQTRFSLKDVIPNNIVVRNQKQTNLCWAFTSLASLETNLALANHDAKKYDFSERHMGYATSRIFLNDVINPKGHNREAGGERQLFYSKFLFNQWYGSY